MKQMVRFLSIFLAASIFVSCDKNEGLTPEPESSTTDRLTTRARGTISLMTIELTDRFMENSTDKWVFATNQDGQLLDIVQLKPQDQSIELKTTMPVSRIDFTIVSFFSQLGNFTLETFKNFPINESIKFGVKPDKVITQAGVANIKVTNYNESIAANLNISFVTAAFGPNSITSPSITGSTFSVYVNLGASDETVHAYGLRSGIGVYKMLTNVIPNESRSSDFSDFEPFQNFMTLPYLGFAYTIGIKEDNTQFVLVLSSRHSVADSRKIYLGTVPGFPKYETYIRSNSAFEYWKIGSPISSFNTPSYTTFIENNTIKNFNATISGTHDYKYAEFTATSGGNTWMVHSSNTTPLGINFEIPAQLKKVYPSLTFDGLQYTSGSFYRSSGTYTYNDMLANRFKNVLKDEFEVYTLPIK